RAGTSWWQALTIEEHVQHYIDQSMERKEAMKRAAGDRGVSKREIYNELLKE
ncbi:MAG: Uroporphyrin-III C/tetrapyrrole (Corrin/Porphyrin) methyltransferase, partial [Paenibacillus sp.]|nr:Uroporphyrin-III C/tetrapyrrole (Corrin/Porphyrin) methyltransferase [Paenibacillus sp.]